MGRCVQTFNWSCFCFLVNTNQNIMQSEIIWFSNVLPFAKKSGRKPIRAQNVSSPPTSSTWPCDWKEQQRLIFRLPSRRRACLCQSFQYQLLLWVPFNVASLQWCPPCRALLPELRKASIQLAGQMKFGTIDCTIHHNLCSTVRTPVGILTFSLDRNIRKSREELVLQCNDLLFILGRYLFVSPICYFFLLVQHPGLSDDGHL